MSDLPSEKMSGPKGLTPDRQAVPDPSATAARDGLPAEPQPRDTQPTTNPDVADFPPSGHESTASERLSDHV